MTIIHFSQSARKGYVDYVPSPERLEFNGERKVSIVGLA